MWKLSPTAEIVYERELDSSENGLDVFERFEAGGSCAYSPHGKLGCVLARTMNS